MLLIGFTIRIYHDARSSECQIRASSLFYTCNKNSVKYLKGIHFSRLTL